MRVLDAPSFLKEGFTLEGHWSLQGLPTGYGGVGATLEGCLPGRWIHRGMLDEATGASKVDGEFSELVPTSIWLGRLKEGKKNGAHYHFCSQRELLQISDPLAHVLKLVSKSFHALSRYFSICFFSARSQTE